MEFYFQAFLKSNCKETIPFKPFVAVIFAASFLCARGGIFYQ